MALPSQCLSWALLSDCAGTRRAGAVSEPPQLLAVAACVHAGGWGDGVPL